MAILVAVVGLGLLIAAHEAGHLALARMMGMRVETFSLGFGPRIWGFRRGETDYRLSALPRSEEHTSELQSRLHLVCRLLLEKKKTKERAHGQDVARAGHDRHVQYS